MLTTLSCLTCLTALRLAGFDVDGGEQEVLPPSCSRLTRLATLEFVGCSLLVVPPVLEVSMPCSISRQIRSALHVQ